MLAFEGSVAGSVVVGVVGLRGLRRRVRPVELVVVEEGPVVEGCLRVGREG